jgi:hypothetical protein
VTPGTLQNVGTELAAQRLGGLVDVANEPVSKPTELRRQLDEKVADYVREIEAGESLPPHAFLAGFFTLSFPGRSIGDLQERLDTGARLAPVAPLHQQSNLFEPAGEQPSELWTQVMPDEGRRVQLWWDELGPGHPPVRADEAIRFIQRAEWLGRVDAIRGDRFSATLWDRDYPGAEEQSEFFIEQVSATDQQRLVIGADFYWTVGYVENVLGERSGTSRIRMKREHAYPPAELEPDANAAGEEIIELFGLSPRAD